jgi:hypothetical protein
LRKGIQLKALIWIEGEDAPAHDYAKYTIQALQDVIAAGKSRYPKLKFRIKKIEEDTSEEEE